MTIPGTYLATIVDLLADAIPAHARICRMNQHYWSATWTTPRGIWRIKLRDPTIDSPAAEIAGPNLRLTMQWPDPDLLMQLLRKIGALDERTERIIGYIWRNPRNGTEIVIAPQEATTVRQPAATNQDQQRTEEKKW